jgi:3-dehydroquinate dehydratase-2
MRIVIINGPNLNLLGTREPDVYGSKTLADLETELREAFQDVSLDFTQSNHEGDIVDAVQHAARDEADGIVLNGAGYTHTSVAIRDAISASDVPVVEVHISNIHAREEFRRVSLTAEVATGVITGLGTDGYHLAVRYLADHHAR